MLFDNKSEIDLLNIEWKSYLNTQRLKNLFLFSKEVLKFINNLEIISFADNSDDHIFTYTPAYEIQIPQFSYVFKAQNEKHELNKYPFYNSWYIDDLRIKDFLKISEEMEKNIICLFDNFKIFERLEKIKYAQRLNYYQERYKNKSFYIKEIFLKREDCFLVFEDGTKAKIINQ